MRLTTSIIGACALVSACGDQAREPAAQSTPLATASVSAAAESGPQVKGPERRILAFGDSLFAGYRLGRGQGYPERLQAALRKRGINARVTNAGVSGDTTADGLHRFRFVMDSLDAPPDLAIVELGGNDLLRGIPPGETRQNLAAIVAELHRRHVPVLMMGMRAPPNMGSAYVEQFNATYPVLAKQFGAELVPFFQAPIFDKPALLQPDHLHPTAQGVEALVAATADLVATALGSVS